MGPGVTGLGGSAEVEGFALHGSGESPPHRGSKRKILPLGVPRVADSAAVVRQHGDLGALATAGPQGRRGGGLEDRLSFDAGTDALIQLSVAVGTGARLGIS